MVQRPCLDVEPQRLGGRCPSHPSRWPRRHDIGLFQAGTSGVEPFVEFLAQHKREERANG